VGIDLSTPAVPKASIDNPQYSVIGEASVNHQIVLSLYDLTGKMVLPWHQAGYTCMIVDIQHPRGVSKTEDRLYKIGVDILEWIPPLEDYRIVFSFSPCNDMAVSGARWFQDKGLSALASGIALFSRGKDIGQWSRAPWMAEHPVSTISSYYRKADYIFSPHEFDGYTQEDNNYTKKTCIWHGNGFKIPSIKKPSQNPDNRIHRMPPSKDRANLRSATPMGFANAVFVANEIETVIAA